MADVWNENPLLAIWFFIFLVGFALMVISAIAGAYVDGKSCGARYRREEWPTVVAGFVALWPFILFVFVLAVPVWTFNRLLDLVEHFANDDLQR